MFHFRLSHVAKSGMSCTVTKMWRYYLPCRMEVDNCSAVYMEYSFFISQLDKQDNLILTSEHRRAQNHRLNVQHLLEL
jgi:hypothetical protein